MMNKNIRDLLLVSTVLSTGEFEDLQVEDDAVRECIMDMYFYMLCKASDNPKKEHFLSEFNKKYNNLTKEQRRIVKEEYIDIIKTQNKNREKVKKKGMINYE